MTTSRKVCLVRPRSRFRQLHDGARRWDAMRDGKESNKAFAERLRIMRIAFGYDEATMAAEIGVSLPTYRKWEQGHEQRKFSSVVDFAGRHEISLDWIIAGDGERLRRNIGDRVKILPVSTPEWRKHRKRMVANAIADACCRLSPVKQTAAIMFLAGLAKETDPTPTC